MTNIDHNTFIIADTHFGHLSIIKYEGRPFSSIDEMDDFMVEKWNSVVKPGDDVLHLGDLTYHNQSKSKAIIARLNGNIDMIWGNHDKHSEKWYQDLGIRSLHRIKRWTSFKNERIVFTHFPLCQPFSFPYACNIHGHLHSVGGYFNKRLWTPFNYNASAELIDYTPIKLGEILKAIDFEFIRKEWDKIESRWNDEGEN